jgi:hypothetical protein
MAAKRYRKPVAKPGQLLVKFGSPGNGDQPAICYAWGGFGAASGDGRALSNALEGPRHVPISMSEIIAGKGELGDFVEIKSLLSELEERGYDLTTFKLTIEQKKS